MFRRLSIGLVLAGLVAVLAVASVAAHTSFFTIDRNATLSPGGTLVTVTGTLQCGVGHTFQLNVEVFQGDGQSQENGSGFLSGVCNGGLQAWQVTVQSFTGPYHSGRAVARATNFTSGPDGFEQFIRDAQIRLG